MPPPQWSQLTIICSWPFSLLKGCILEGWDSVSFIFFHNLFSFLGLRKPWCSPFAPVCCAVEVKHLSVEHNTFAAAPQGTIKQMASSRVIFLYWCYCGAPCYGNRRSCTLELEQGGGRKDSEAAVWDRPCSSSHSSAGTSTSPAHCGIGVYPARWWVTGAMLHQSHLLQLPHELLQPENTCSNSWATRRMISLSAEGIKDQATWSSALGAGENGIPAKSLQVT